MTVYEAMQIARDYYKLTNPTEDDTFMFTEALNYLVTEAKDPNAMAELGGMYYGERQYDLAIKYYEMAAEYDNVYAIAGLGYIWYYGRTGVKDYEKAFHYFSRAKDLGDMEAAYKVADMYKNGYYVEKNPGKYKEIIEDLYRKLKKNRHPFSARPNVCTRLAKIRSEEGKTDEALRLYDEARGILAMRIQINKFWGDLNVMKWMINDIYALREFDEDMFDLYDLYYLLLRPVKVRFFFEETQHEIEAVEENGEVVIRFDDKWYRTVDDLFQKAEIDGELLTTLYEELYDFEVVH